MHMHESGTLSPPIAASASLHSNQAGLFAPSVRLGMSSPSCNSCGHLLHSPQTPCKVATPPAPVWRKILYEAQPFEDNYTPSTFLSSAELNPNLQHHTFRRMYAFFGRALVFKNIYFSNFTFYLSQHAEYHANHAANFVYRSVLCRVSLPRS
jgi:hypothetical protein